MQALHEEGIDTIDTTFLGELLRDLLDNELQTITNITMKNYALLLIVLVLNISNPWCSSPACFVAAKEDVVDQNSVVAEYNKSGLGLMLDWGLAKVESVFDGQLMNELFSAFLLKCEHMFTLMITSFADMFMSYSALQEREVERLAEFDSEFSDLVKLRQKIDRRCLLSANEEERTLCVEKGVDIKNKLQALRSQRSKSSNAIERYESWMEWCTSYKNWFC